MSPRNHLLTAPIGSTMARMAAPNIIAMFVTTATTMAEAWYVGQLGTVALAGLALGFPMFMLITMLSAGSIGGATAGLVARHLGSGNRAGADAIVLHAVFLAFLFAILSAALFLFCGEAIFSALGGKGRVLEAVLSYSDLLFAGILSIWLFNGMGSVLRGAGQMKVAAFWMIVASTIQIAVGGVLILGVGPFPQMGIAGAGVAVVVGFSIGALGQITILMSGRVGVTLCFRGIRLEWRHFADILRIGLVASISPVSTIGTTIVITAFSARVGTAALAGYGIGSRLELLLVPLVFGIGAACITMVGVHFGAGEIDRGHRIGWTGGIAGGVITGFVGIIFALFPSLWADLFSDSEAVREACRAYLRIVGPSYFFFGLGLCLYFASQGTGRVFWPVLGSVARFIIVLGGGLIAYSLGQDSLDILFMLVALGMVVFGLFIAGSVKLGVWRRGLKTSEAG
ncbi:MAG: cation transporter [Sneathiella sp.]|nr:MAG: cation transporter [Sneathiella sp.]